MLQTNTDVGMPLARAIILTGTDRSPTKLSSFNAIAFSEASLQVDPKTAINEACHSLHLVKTLASTATYSNLFFSSIHLLSNNTALNPSQIRSETQKLYIRLRKQQLSH